MDAVSANSPFEVALQVAGDAGELPDGVDWSHWTTVALSMAAVANGTADSLTVRIVSKDESRQLNKTYRSTDAATNVLAFPGPESDALPADEVQELGDLVICLPVVYTEAQRQGKEPLAHLAHLVVHGALHLVGFDHQDDSTAEQMEKLETQIMRRLGFPDPYEGQ